MIINFFNCFSSVFLLFFPDKAVSPCRYDIPCIMCFQPFRHHSSTAASRASPIETALRTRRSASSSRCPRSPFHSHPSGKSLLHRRVLSSPHNSGMRLASRNGSGKALAENDAGRQKISLSESMVIISQTQVCRSGYSHARSAAHSPVPPNLRPLRPKDIGSGSLSQGCPSHPKSAGFLFPVTIFR